MIIPSILVIGDKNKIQSMIKDLIKHLALQKYNIILVKKPVTPNEMSHNYLYREIIYDEHSFTVILPEKIQFKKIITEMKKANVLIIENYPEIANEINGLKTIIYGKQPDFGISDFINYDDTQKEKILSEIDKHIAYWQQIKEIYDELPKIDCGRCGYEKCIRLAQKIQSGSETIEKCVVREQMKKSVTRIFIDGQEIQVIKYISNLFQKTILAMVSTLKGVDITGDEHIEIKIKKKKKHS